MRPGPVLLPLPMLRTARALVLLVLCLLSGKALAQSAHEPAAGSAERRAIMDVLRPAAKKDIGRDIIFKVDLLRVAGEWAYARVAPVLPDGGQIDFSKTKFREQIELGAFDPQGEALLRREGGTWQVLEWRFGATDVESPLWAERYRLPASLLQ